jgi:hypothetical protein
VKKHTEPHGQFDAGKEKEIFKEERQEFLKQDVASTSTVQHTQNIPIYDIPLSMDHTREVPPIVQLSTIKKFLQSCLKLLNDPSSVNFFQNMLERCNTKLEGKLEHKIVNHLHTRRRKRREFIINANIGYFNMEDIILDLGSEVNVLPKKTW